MCLECWTVKMNMWNSTSFSSCLGQEFFCVHLCVYISHSKKRDWYYVAKFFISKIQKCLLIIYFSDQQIRKNWLILLKVHHPYIYIHGEVLSFRVFGLLSSSLSLYSQRFGRCVLPPSSDVSCRTREPTRNFEPRPLFNPRGSLVLIPLQVYKY